MTTVGVRSYVLGFVTKTVGIKHWVHPWSRYKKVLFDFFGTGFFLLRNRVNLHSVSNTGCFLGPDIKRFCLTFLVPDFFYYVTE